jgi:hypothetical protein
MTLFDPGPALSRSIEPGEHLSADARRTRRRELDIARGVHPLTKRPLRGDGETCGTCVNCFAVGRNRTYYKCRLVAVTNGPGTDVRLKWPACINWGGSERVTGE